MKNFIIPYLIIFILLIGCMSKTEKHDSINSKSEITQSKFQKDSTEIIQWLSKFHDSMNEPDLTDLDYECFRFNFLDSFGKNKLFRIEKLSQIKFKLVVKLYNTTEMKNSVIEETISISEEQYNEFKKHINGSYFWSLEMLDYPGQYLDGYAYLLEGYEPNSLKKKERHHIVAREVPYSGSFKKACEKLMEFYNQENSEQ
ncbi:MAG: hypothetical protein GYB35_13610 [Algicola sp.]|nr:hypothetical protein [Algicola sp.]